MFSSQFENSFKNLSSGTSLFLNNSTTKLAEASQSAQPLTTAEMSIILVSTNFILTFTSSPHIGLRISKDRLKSSKAIIFLFFAARLNIFS